MSRLPHSLTAVILALPFLAACQNQGPVQDSKTSETAPIEKSANITAPANTAVISGMSFSLMASDKRCVLIGPYIQKYVLDMPGSCDFHRLESGEIQIEDGHHGPVFLVESSVPAPGSEDYEKEDCDTRLTAVTIKEGQIYLQKSVSKMANCATNDRRDDIHFLAPIFSGLK